MEGSYIAGTQNCCHIHKQLVFLYFLKTCSLKMHPSSTSLKTLFVAPKI